MHKVEFELNKKSPQPGKVEGIGFMLFIKSGQLEFSYTPGHPSSILDVRFAIIRYFDKKMKFCSIKVNKTYKQYTFYLLLFFFLIQNCQNFRL